MLVGSKIKNRVGGIMFDYIVIGKGMMGSAAARYLAEKGTKIAVVGPDEPKDFADHPGIFASHYDEGRLTRLLAKDITWSWLSHYSIQNYRYLEEESNISFYAPCGLLYAVKNLSNYYIFSTRQTVENLMGGKHSDYASTNSITQAHPMFVFPAHFKGMFEHAPAGCINPRAFVRAEIAIAQKCGAEIVPEIAVKTAQTRDTISVTTQSGRTLEAQKILYAGGSFANTFEVLPVKLDLRIKTEFTVLAEVSEQTAYSLDGMPCAIYEIESNQLDGIYLTPPRRYPDGKFYIKMGCDTKADQNLDTLAGMQTWMREGSNAMLGEMGSALTSFMPDIKPLNFLMKPCLVTYTTHRKPYIDQLTDRLFVATGGNGASAKCADALGTLAAKLLLDEAWLPEFSREEFKVSTLG